MSPLSEITSDKLKPSTTKKLVGEYASVVRKLFLPFEKDMDYPKGGRRWWNPRPAITLPDGKTAPARAKALHRQINALRARKLKLESELDKLGWKSSGSELAISNKRENELYTAATKRHEERRALLNQLNLQARMDLMDMAPKQAAVYLRTLASKLDRIKRSGDEDCYAYVRDYYKVPAYVGVKVRLTRTGVIATLANHRRARHYLWLRLPDQKHLSGPYHPTDEIEYLP